ncbi:MAG: hypothetical protein M1821_002874 [Bathelium mastoideum]|nr:MAG: hypothetical protein M1821_002874 [Bathelium mastoideum]
MMHPSRQAYVEEDHPELVSQPPRAAFPRIDGTDAAIDRDYDIPGASSGVAPEKASAILQQFERKRFAKTIAVPTDDGRVRARLRELGEPITLFGEGPADRRDRLRELLADQAAASGDLDTPMRDVIEDQEEDNEADEEFYTEGPPELLDVRKDVARYSLPRARARIAQQTIESSIPLRAHVRHRKAIKERLAGFDLYGSQVVADRPVSIARFSPSGEMIAAGHFGGGIQFLSVPNLEKTQTLRGHTGRVGGIAWFPNATLPSTNVSSAAVNLASSGGEGDNNVNLWSLEEDAPVAVLSGHSGRVCRVEFHPSGRYLASASHDTTWRLWDVATTTELLLQEGHSAGVHTVSFNSDGSLLASAGLDSIGRIWDLRTGRTVMILDGHIKEISALDWGPDCHRVLTGSIDGFVKCWDVRAVRETASVGANKGGVTDLRWFKGSTGAPTTSVTIANGGETNGTHEEQQRDGALDSRSQVVPKKSGTFFISSGLDKNINIFSADDWALCKSLGGHSGNIFSTDVTDDARWILSSGYDRTVKLWARDDCEGI